MHYICNHDLQLSPDEWNLISTNVIEKCHLSVDDYTPTYNHQRSDETSRLHLCLLSSTHLETAGDHGYIYNAYVLLEVKYKL